MLRFEDTDSLWCFVYSAPRIPSVRLYLRCTSSHSHQTELQEDDVLLEIDGTEISQEPSPELWERVLHHKCAVIELLRMISTIDFKWGYRYLMSRGFYIYSLIFGISALPRGQILDVVFKRFILTYTSFLWVTSKSYVNHGIFRGKVFLDELAAHLHLKKQLLHRIMLMRGWSRIIKAIPYIVGSLAVGYFEVSVFSMKWSTSALWIPILDELCKDVYKVLPRFPSFYCMVFEVR